MSPKELNELKINALALRNIACKVLEQVERLEKKNTAQPTKTKRSRKDIKDIMEADLIERLLTGRRKPILA